MRLSELVAPRKDDTFNLITRTFKDVDNDRVGERASLIRNLLTELQNRGFKPLGFGAFGMVFTHPNLDYVIKIFKADPAYVAFIEYAIENSSNPSLPKFKGRFVRLGSKDSRLYAVRLERLDPTGGRFKLEKEFLRQIHIVTVRDLASSLQDAIEVVVSEDWIDRMKRLRQITDTTESYFRGIAEDSSVISGSAVAIWELMEIKDRKRLTFDLHDGNFMMRDNSQLVIIDPFCN